jgi:hypothetical protein
VGAPELFSIVLEDVVEFSVQYGAILAHCWIVMFGDVLKHAGQAFRGYTSVIRIRMVLGMSYQETVENGGMKEACQTRVAKTLTTFILKTESEHIPFSILFSVVLTMNSFLGSR